jgi:hypothetical protein
MDTPTSLAQFRTGTGRTNAPPWVGPVVISEVMYHPVSGPTNNLVENPDEEYVELHNPTASEVRLYDPAHLTNTWRLAGGVDYAFASGVSLGAGETVLVVNFDPGMDPLAESAFRLRYGLTGAVRLFGPYGGQLSNRGEALELLQPDAPQAPPHPDAGYVPYVRVDYVRYGTASPWPAQADGTGRSLQRRRPQAYGNEPLNWKADAPTPATVAVATADTDTDSDGLPDLWEDAHALDCLDPADALQDPDADGLTNLDEYRAGTDPHEASSNLSIQIVAADDEYHVRFFGQAGRSYTIQYSDAVGSIVWSKLADVPAQSNPGWVEARLARQGSPELHFFRVVSPSQP